NLFTGKGGGHIGPPLQEERVTSELTWHWELSTRPGPPPSPPPRCAPWRAGNGPSWRTTDPTQGRAPLLFAARSAAGRGARPRRTVRESNGDRPARRAP